MRLRSYDQLDFDLAWRRVLNWAQGGEAGIPDRLPYEVLQRLYGGAAPGFSAEHHLQPISLIVSSKRSGTARPFTRVSPLDLTLYQALVDQLAADIETALAPRDVVFAYRQTTGDEAMAFANSPTRVAYEERIREILSFDADVGYAITADIAGYFLHVDVDELEKQLLTISSRSEVVRDVGDLLRAWAVLGVRGLPQGIRPSSPLGNVYLAPLDRLLEEAGVRFVRWMDDLVIAVTTFHEARRVQDLMERLLYDLGLTLASDKTRILRWDTAVEESEGAQRRLTRLKRAHRDAAEAWLAEALTWTDYPPDESELPDPAQLDQEAVETQYLELLASARTDAPLPQRFATDVIAALRDLESLEHPVALDQIPTLLTRSPDITPETLRYLAAVAKHDLAGATEVYGELLGADRFMRDFEKLALCVSLLGLPLRSATRLATPLASWALNDASDLVRARALLAWGAQSRADDFSVSDKYWGRASPQWRPYAVVAIQDKSTDRRNSRYERWSAAGSFTDRLVRAIKRGKFGWRKL